MQVERTDYLVIGAGVAGLWFALHAAQHGRVCVLAKGALADSATQLAQGGIAAVLDPADSPEAHLADTLAAGAGLVEREVAEMVIREGPAQVSRLLELGMRLARDADNRKLALAREGGHSNRRVVHAADATGAELMRTLLAAARACPNITLTAHTSARALLTDEHGRCHGCCVVTGYGAARQMQQRHLHARGTVLATGGLGRLFRYTTNPRTATGDGLALAARVGCTLRDLEFVQFHPTCLYTTEEDRPVITEALRGEGAMLRDAAGKRFVDSLAPRDVVAREIALRLRERDEPCVYLDATALDSTWLQLRFPNVVALCLEHRVDPRREPIPVVPAAHYHCGGVRTGLHGETDVAGLYAVGEVASTGLHGANRLASNSLLEALVFAVRAAEHAQTVPVPLAGFTPHVAESATEVTCARRPSSGTATRSEIARLMWQHCGLQRSKSGLHSAAQQLAEMAQTRRRRSRSTESSNTPRATFEVENMLLAARLIVHAAASRTESRGAHFLYESLHATETLPSHTELTWQDLDPVADVL